MDIFNGNLFINNNFNVKFFSQVSVHDNPSTVEIKEGRALIVGNSLISSGSVLNADGICAKNICQTTSTCVCSDPGKFDECSADSCPPKSLSMPTIDFDSSDPASYKSRAQAAESQGQCSIVGKNSGGVTVLTSADCLFTESGFEDLLWQMGEGGKLILENKTNGVA